MTPLLPRIALLAAGIVLSTQGFAMDFDGAKPLICAPVEAIDCSPGQDCLRGTPDDIGAPSFIRIDFLQKTVTSTQRTTPIEAISNTGGRLLLRGTELGYGWTLVIDQASGKLSATLTDSEGAFVMFGACTLL